MNWVKGPLPVGSKVERWLETNAMKKAHVN